MAAAKDDKQVKIAKWDGSACKNAIDDAVKDILKTRFKYDECYRLIDGRLMICGVAVGVAMFALIWDYFFPFPLSRHVLIFCVSTYFILMGVLTLFTTYKEKGIFIVTVQKDGNSWEASSQMAKFDDLYLLTLSLQDGKTGKITQATITRSVGNFIDDNGGIVTDAIEPEVVKLHNSLLSSKKDK